MKKRIAVIHKDKCNPQGCGNYLCAKLCPVNRTGEDCVKEGDETTTKAIIDEVLCTGCGICPKRCPYGAIEIINLPKELDKPPIHRYGENSFALFSLPTPIFNKVVGILGKNGIGKSTAFKVLAGFLKANLGQFDQEITNKQVLDYFKGTQMQAFLEELFKNKITLAYKPQQVESLPKTFKGTVQDLLEKAANNKENTTTTNETKEASIKEIAESLDLTKYLQRKIANLSGGELQRVVIAATALKNANLTLFDEPSSYLDIKQRMKMSKFIKHLATNTDTDKAVMVIEHDLIILDFMTDLLNIMYGHDGVYGIVSQLKNVREGINQFLHGELTEENVRFRSRPLKFEGGVDKGQTLPDKLIEWTDLNKDYGPFKLNAGSGTIYKNEVIGIVGENGIGKTTFIKLLAGLEKPTNGELDKKLEVSYKGQYLDFQENTDLVADFLHEAVNNYNNQLVKPLELDKFLTKQLNQLSGGELQRVVVAKTLAKEADIYLLDEPSAYLDIEQRLLITKVIKRFAIEKEATVLVVDHDLLFLDNLSDRMLVFTGTPAKEGSLQGPLDRTEAMNLFLKELDITLRRDHQSKRPRINNPGSVKDREQRQQNNWYSSK